MAGTSDNSFEFLQKLEDFFSSPDFTTAVGSFFGDNGPQLEFKAIEEEQPMKNHDIYQKYCQMVEQQLETFMSKEGLTSQKVFEAVQKAHSSGQASWLTCIDYLLASTEYESFLQLAYDHVCMTLEGEALSEGEEWDAPPEDEAEEGAEASGAGASGAGASAAPTQ